MIHKNRVMNLPSVLLTFLFLLFIVLACSRSSEPVGGDRSNLSLTEAIPGHWKEKEGLLNVKNEYFQKVASDSESDDRKYEFYYTMSWDTSLGEKSDGKSVELIHEVNEKNGWIILKYTSRDGVYTYYNRYQFNAARNEYTVEEIDIKNGESRYDLPYKFVYAGAQNKADHIE